MIESNKWLTEIREITKTLIAIPSISPDVDAENRCAEKILELLSQPFQGTNETPEFNPVFWNTNDGRKSVACLLKSLNPESTGKTIILMGHFDTVGVEDFGRFGDSNIAFQPDKLAKAIKANLDQKFQAGLLDTSQESAYQALQSGEWMFGRGSVDMKSGVAINLAVFREFARVQKNGQRLIDDFAGNLLFLACPDEETESAGILSAVPELLQLREKENLTYLGVINTDYTAPRDANEDTRYIYSGTVGKLLPSFYTLGVRTHVGEIFRGVDASHIAAELVSRINLNPEWIDTWQGTLGGESITEVAPPPVALHMRDLKSFYNVETAGEAFVYVNWLTLTLTPEQAMAKLKDAASAALEAVYNRIGTSYRHFASLGGQAQPPPAWTGFILNYESLLHEANFRWEMENRKGRLSDWLKAKAEELKPLAQDGRQLSRMIVAELVKIAAINGPAVITFFSPPFYPSIQPQENEITLAVKSVLDLLQSPLSPRDHRENEFFSKGSVNSVARQPIQFRGFYPYISDLSYVQLDSNVEIESLKMNMPLFDLVDSNKNLYYPLDSEKLTGIRALNCPVINIGPFGRDAHGLYERVHMPYSFEVVPELIYKTISNCFTIAGQ